MSEMYKKRRSAEREMAHHKRRLNRLLRVLCSLGILLGVVAYSTGCAAPVSSREPIQPSYRHASAEPIGDRDPGNQASPDGSR